MLRSMNDLEDYSIAATDGVIGRVKDFYFDDATWVIRYFVVETGSWLSSRKVLISPFSISRTSREQKTLSVSITRDQVRNSPDIDTDKPVSRQHEMGYLGYYGYPAYWGGAGIWGDAAAPEMLLPGYEGLVSSPYALHPEENRMLAQAEAIRHQHDDPHLRSCQAVIGYHIEATDGDIGHVQGLLVEENTWSIRYMVVDTSNWWLGHRVLIAPQWIHAVRWGDSSVSVDLTRQAVQAAPAYDSTAELNRVHESSIYGHYGRTGYWADAAKRKAA